MADFGVSFREDRGGVTPVRTVPTAVIGLLSIMTWGPHDAWESTSFPEWESKGGPPTVDGFGYLWAKAAYDLVGDGLRIVNKRIVHYSNIANASSKTSAAATLNVNTDNNAAVAGSVTSSNPHPYALTTGQTLVITVDGGSPTTATFTGTAAARETVSGGPFNLANGQTLTVKIDQGALQTITFLTGNFVSISAATALEVVNVINTYFLDNSIGAVASVTNSTKVTITSNKKGTGSHVEVTNAGTATALDFSNTEANGSGNVASLAAVTLSEVKTIVEAAVSGLTVSDASGYTKITSNTLGASSSILVGASSTADTPMGFDNATHSGTAAGAFARLTLDAKYDGDRGNDLAGKFSAASNGDSGYFNFAQLENGVQVGPVITNCALDPDSVDYFVTKLNDEVAGASLFVVTDLAVDSPALPLLGTSANLAGGSDGLSSLADTDFTGNQAAKTGLFGLDARDDVPGTSDITMIAVPDRPTSSVHNAGATYCEVYRRGNAMFIVDLPSNLTVDQAVTYVTSTASLFQLSDHLVCFYDRIKVDNPRTDIFGTSSATVTVPNSCVVAGVRARADAARPGGFSDPCCNEELGRVGTVVRGLERGEASDAAKFEKLQAYLMNAIVRFNGGPYQLLGSYTMRSDGQFPEWQEKHLVIVIKKSLEVAHLKKIGMETEEGIKACEAQANSYLRSLAETPMRCFRKTKFTDAVLVDYSDALNKPSTKILGLGFGRIKLATKKSLKKLDVALGQNLSDVQAELAAAAA